LLVTLGFQSWTQPSLAGRLAGDGLLTDASADFLQTWLAKRKVEGPTREREAAAERERAWEARWPAWARG